jgi:hypothetical protein
MRSLNQAGIKHPRQRFAALLHDGIMISCKERARKQCQQIHPDWRGTHLPLVTYGGHGTIRGE